MISHRAIIFAALAIGLNILLSLLVGTFLLALSIGMALMFALTFLLVPFIAAWLVGFKSPVQLIVIFMLTVVIGAFLNGLFPSGALSLIGTAATYISAAAAAEMIVR